MAKRPSDEFNIDMDGLRKSLTSDKSIEDSLKLLSSSPSNIYDDFIDIGNYVYLCSEATPCNSVSDSGVSEEETPEYKTKPQLASVYSYSWHHKDINREGVVGTFHLPERSSPKGFLDALEDDEFYDSNEVDYVSPSLFFPRQIDVKRENLNRSSNIKRDFSHQDSNVFPSTSKAMLTGMQGLEDVSKALHSKITNFTLKQSDVNDLSRSPYKNQPNATKSSMLNISSSSVEELQINTADVSFTESNSDNESFHSVAGFEDAVRNTNINDPTKPLDLSSSSREDVHQWQNLFPYSVNTNNCNNSIEKHIKEDFSDMSELKPIAAMQTTHIAETKVDNKPQLVNSSLVSTYPTNEHNGLIQLPNRITLQETDRETNKNVSDMSELELIDTPILLNYLLESNTNFKSTNDAADKTEIEDPITSIETVRDTSSEEDDFGDMPELEPIKLPHILQQIRNQTIGNSSNRSHTTNSHNNSNNSTNEDNETNKPLDLSKGSDELVSSTEPNSDDEEFADMPELEPVPLGVHMQASTSHASASTSHASAASPNSEDFSDMPELEPIPSTSSASSGMHVEASTSYLSSTDFTSEEDFVRLPELESSDVPALFGISDKYLQPSTSFESGAGTVLEEENFSDLFELERTEVPNLLSSATFVADTDSTDVQENKFRSLPEIEPATVPILMGYLQTNLQTTEGELPESFTKEEGGCPEGQCKHIQAMASKTTNAGDSTKLATAGTNLKGEEQEGKEDTKSVSKIKFYKHVQAAVISSAVTEEIFTDLPELGPMDHCTTSNILVHQSPEGCASGSDAFTVTEMKSFIVSPNNTKKIEQTNTAISMISTANTEQLKSSLITSLEPTVKDELIDLSETGDDAIVETGNFTADTKTEQNGSMSHENEQIIKTLENKRKSTEQGYETPKTLTPPQTDVEDEIGLLGKYSPSKAVDADTDTETLIASGNNSEDDNTSEIKCRKLYLSRTVNKKATDKTLLGKQTAILASATEINFPNAEQKENEPLKLSEDSLQAEKNKEVPATDPVTKKPTTPKRTPLFIDMSPSQKASKRSPDVWHDKTKQEEFMKSPKIQKTKYKTPFDDFSGSSSKKFIDTSPTGEQNPVASEINKYDVLPGSSSSTSYSPEDKTDSSKAKRVHTATPHPKTGAKRNIGPEFYKSKTQSNEDLSSSRKVDKRRSASNITEEDSNDELEDIKELESINAGKDTLLAPLPSKQSKRPDTPSPSKTQDPNETVEEAFVKPTTRYVCKGKNILKKRNS